MTPLMPLTFEKTSKFNWLKAHLKFSPNKHWMFSALRYRIPMLWLDTVDMLTFCLGNYVCGFFFLAGHEAIAALIFVPDPSNFGQT